MRHPTKQQVCEKMFDFLMLKGSCFSDFEADEVASHTTICDYFSVYISQEMYFQAKKDLVDMIEETSYYIDNGMEYLQLSDNSTLMNMPLESLQRFDFGTEYRKRLFFEIEKFNERTTADGSIVLLGRSGRHVCLPITCHNQFNYQDYQKIANELECDLVSYFEKEGGFWTS